MTKPGSKQKLFKAEASRFFKAVIGSGSGVWEVTPGVEYGVRNGQLVYVVELVDNWPNGTALKLSIYTDARLLSNGTFFNRETFILDWKKTEFEARKRELI